MYHLKFNRSSKYLLSFFFPIYALVCSQFFQFRLSTSEPDNMALTLSVTSNGPLCAGSTLDLTPTPAGGTAPYTYVWSGPAFSNTQPNPSIANTTTANSGTYFVTVTDGTTATATASVVVTVNAQPIVNAGPDQVLCKGTPAQLAGSIGGGASSAGWTASVAGGSFSPISSALNAVYTPPNNFTGNITLTLTTNDPAGPCTARIDQVLIQYGGGSAVNCNDIVFLSIDGDCNTVVTPDMVAEGDILEPLYTVTLFTLQGVNIGNTVTAAQVGQTLKARLRDNCNGNTCTTDVVVSDALAPILTCEDITLPCAVSNTDPNYLKNVLGIVKAIPTVTENCGPYTLTRFDTWVDVPCNQSFNGITDLAGYIRRVWTVKDPSNNTSTCTQFLYFKNISIYDLQLPIDVTVSCENVATNPTMTGLPYFEAYGLQFPLSGTAGFCNLSIEKQDQVISLCAGSNSILRTWTLYDLCKPFSTVFPQNPINYVQLINVNDPTGPVFACPTNMTLSTNALSCCTTVNLPDVIMEDACSYVRDASAIIITTDPITGDPINTQYVDATVTTFAGNNLQDKDTLAVFPNSPCLPIGNHTIIYQAEDGCGANSTCSFRITITDGTPPLAVCDEYTQVALGIDGMALVFAETFDDGSYDNCSPVRFKVRRNDANPCQPVNRFFDAAKFCCEDVGDTIMVTLRVYDVPVPAGEVSLEFEEQHSNECNVAVYVEDKLKPVCIPPANVTVTCENFDPSLWAHGQPDAIDNCCLDTITRTVNYNLFDTTCNRGTIVRTFRAFDCYGNSNICTQRIVVNYQQDYFVKFPDDATVNTCDGTGIYGKPTFFGQACELMAVSYEDAVFTVVTDACYKIERTWTIINWCQYNPNGGCVQVPNPSPNANSNSIQNLPGPIVSAFGTAAPWAPTVVKINSTDTNPTNYSTFYNPSANCYRYKQIIKIVDQQKPVAQCPTTPLNVCDDSHNDASLWNTGNGLDGCEGPADVCITATDACSGPNISFRYLLFLDTNNDGSMETVINSNNPPTPGTVNVGNATNPNYTGGTVTTFDNRLVAANQKYNWGLQTTVVGNNVTACIKWNSQANPGGFSNPQLPYGTHKVKWLISDGCGNETTCEYLITVKDCKSPSVLCLNGLTANIMQTGMVQIYASAFLQTLSDNCTPTNKLKVSMRKSGTGTGFPKDASGAPITSLTWTCLELGTQFVEIWAIDEAGNADYCETYVIIQDNAGNCAANASIAGAITTELGNGVEEADVQLIAQPVNGLPSVDLFNHSDGYGLYNFNNALPMSSNYTLVPFKEGDPLNGVTTYDLVLISKHILGSEPLNSPYKLIAADANKSGTITTFDIVEFRKLILGLYTELPSNSSWRFIDEAYYFPDMNNPFVETIPEVKESTAISADNMEDNFVAVKIGDVNGSAIANSLMTSDDRSAGVVYMETDDQVVQAGDVVDVKMAPSESVAGYQMTMQFDGLDVISVQPGEKMTEDNFAIFQAQHAVTTSWDGLGIADFTLRLRSQKNGRISKMLSLSSRITKTEAYSSISERKDIEMRFKGAEGSDTVRGVGFELYQNQPNPYHKVTLIGFHLPEAEETKLTVFDETGRVLYTERKAFAKGYNKVLIDGSKLDAGASLLYYKVETPTYSATKKMIKS